MKKAVVPFLTIPDEAIVAQPWEVTLSSGKCYTDPEFLDEWDNGTDISLFRRIEFDFASCVKALNCPEDETKLEVVVSVGTGAGSIPVERWIHRYPIDSVSASLFIELDESGENFADVLHIETNVILSDSVPNPILPISPVHEGSIVWHEKKRIRLEGDVSRFPVSETNLERLLGSDWKDALWYLQVDWEDLGAAFDSSVRLHINSLQDEFAKRFRNGDKETVHVVMADVIVQISSGCLKVGEDWELSVDEDGEVVSLGQVAGHWLEMAFGTIEAARQVYNYDLGRFHAHLNALADQKGREK